MSCSIFKPLSSFTQKEEKDLENKETSEADEQGYLSADEVRGILDSRFESGRVEMLDKETLVLIGPDGQTEYFVKKRQFAFSTQISKMRTLDGASPSPLLTSALLNDSLSLLFPHRCASEGFVDVDTL